MKKLIAFLCAVVLLVCLSGACFADGAPIADVGQPRYSYRSSSYSSAGSRILSKVIAAAIVGAIAGGIKSLTGKNKKDGTGASAQNTAAAPEAEAAPAQQFVCKSCGAISTGWYQTCPYCGSVGQMEKKK